MRWSSGSWGYQDRMENPWVSDRTLAKNTCSHFRFTVSTSVLIASGGSLSPNAGLHPPSRANSLRSRSHPRSRSNSVNAPHPAHHSHPSSLQDSGTSSGGVTPPSANGNADALAAPVPTNILSPVDTQAAQIRHLIASAHVEKDHLQAQIKEARRASQRAEAALRAEIESVKRAVDKAGSLDLRAKQKALALQEQVKQGWAGAEAAEKENINVDGGTGDLENRLEAMKVEVGAVRGEWQIAKGKEEDIREREKKARAEEEKKLTEIVGKVEKLRAKKEKKEVEKAELEKRLEHLTREKEEAEKRNEEEKAARRSSGYYFPRWEEYGHEGHGRSLTAHPSLNNLAGHNQYAAGPTYRPRGGAQGYQPRYPSAGAVRPSPSQPSPTHQSTFFPIQHPVPPANTSPAFRPAKPLAISPATNPRGVNVAAIPFHPSTSYGSSQGFEHTTSLMPPQLQHRIYLPNVRPRPAPNFHPPPSVLAEQSQATRRSSPPAFPPLPGQVVLGQQGGKGTPIGPSLASIVTRAVLSPTSAMAAQNVPPSFGGTRPSPPLAGLKTSGSLPVPISPTTASSSSGVISPPLPTHLGQRIAFSPTQGRNDDFPPLSPKGPWASLPQSHGSGSGSGSSGVIGSEYTGGGASYNMVRTATPVSWGGGGGEGHSPYAAGRGESGSSRKSTGDSA